MVALAGQEPRPRVGPPKRADARRNYEQLVEQAKAVFAEFGADASLDEISRRAGVASGTLYRHFPTRLDLIEVVLAEQIAELVELGRSLSTAAAAFDALATWLRAALAHGLSYRGLAAAALNSASDRNDLVSNWHAELFEIGEILLARARRSGTVVADADVSDVLKMVGAIASAVQDAPRTPAGSAQADRLLALLLNGLRYGDAPG
ncbi:TetR/AcrR family transcriptional regulator [Pseudonocardia sp. TRM90224]|uniref:TetR/AcrR family transcriptional regulator n=1 Tax=Pseudonocardia sp. TRM90224 TaxID=2812678 RepID=UPI001E5A14E8|nr:TetR/AcrR family transcriptional regulator [Pseudonocardia sp. TRM90224]